MLYLIWLLNIAESLLKKPVVISTNICCYQLLLSIIFAQQNISSDYIHQPWKETKDIEGVEDPLLFSFPISKESSCQIEK